KRDDEYERLPARRGELCNERERGEGATQCRVGCDPRAREADGRPPPAAPRRHRGEGRERGERADRRGVGRPLRERDHERRRGDRGEPRGEGRPEGGDGGRKKEGAPA